MLHKRRRNTLGPAIIRPTVKNFTFRLGSSRITNIGLNLGQDKVIDDEIRVPRLKSTRRVKGGQPVPHQQLTRSAQSSFEKKRCLEKIPRIFNTSIFRAYTELRRIQVIHFWGIISNDEQYLNKSCFFIWINYIYIAEILMISSGFFLFKTHIEQL